MVKKIITTIMLAIAALLMAIACRIIKTAQRNKEPIAW